MTDRIERSDRIDIAAKQARALTDALADMTKVVDEIRTELASGDVLDTLAVSLSTLSEAMQRVVDQNALTKQALYRIEPSYASPSILTGFEVHIIEANAEK